MSSALPAGAPGAPGGPEPPYAGVTLRRMVRVAAVRLLLATGALGLALVVIGVGREGAGARAEAALYTTLAVGFLEAGLVAGALAWVRRRLGLLGSIQLGADVAVVTALVHFSGGSDSFFSFLYLPVTLYGAILFERRGAYGSAALGSLGYGLALWAAERWGTRAVFGGPLPGAPLSALWVVHTVALLLVAILGNALSRELRLAGERLAESATRLRRLRDLHQRIVDSLTSGLLTVDASGLVGSFNPEAERITGRSEEDALGRDLESVLPGAGALVMEREDPSARMRARVPFADARGQERTLGIASSILRGSEGEEGGHVVIFQDVTDVVRMEQELRRSERLAATGQLAANMAHEIRNPLAAISGSIEMLRQDAPGLGGAERDRLMDIVLREVQRLDGLIDDFLLFARPKPPAPTSVDVGCVIGEVVEMFEGARPDEVSVAVEVVSRTLALADPTQLRQVLWNLVLNATQAMPSGGELSLRAGTRPPQGPDGENRKEPEGEAAQVEIIVSDTGVGIAPDVLERVFDPFFTTKKGGSGLGLATVHRIVESHGGKLSIESRPGQGTRVHVCLPAAKEGGDVPVAKEHA